MTSPTGSVEDQAHLWSERRDSLKDAIKQAVDFACHEQHLEKVDRLLKKLKEHYKSQGSENGQKQSK